MKKANTWVLGCAMICIAPFNFASADELTAMIEENLAALGYDTGKVDGEADVSTAIAISKYQAEKGMDVTGEASPQLAGILAADVKKQGSTAVSAEVRAAPQPAAVSQPDAVSQPSKAQQACLQQKIASAQHQAQPKKKKGFGGMLSSISKAAGKYGNNELAKISTGIYEANATIDDLAVAARDLGISEAEIAECESQAPIATASTSGTVSSTGAVAAAPAPNVSAASGGSSGPAKQYPSTYMFLNAANSLGNSDGSIAACNRGRPDYRQRFEKMVMEAHPGYAAEALAAYDENFAAIKNNGQVCTDEQLATMKKAAGKNADGAFNMLNSWTIR